MLVILRPVSQNFSDYKSASAVSQKCPQSGNLRPVSEKFSKLDNLRPQSLRSSPVNDARWSSSKVRLTMTLRVAACLGLFLHFSRLSPIDDVMALALCQQIFQLL